MESEQQMFAFSGFGEEPAGPEANEVPAGAGFDFSAMPGEQSEKMLAAAQTAPVEEEKQEPTTVAAPLVQGGGDFFSFGFEPTSQPEESRAESAQGEAPEATFGAFDFGASQP